MISKTRQRSMTIGTDGFLLGQNLFKPLPEICSSFEPSSLQIRWLKFFGEIGNWDS